MLRGFLGRLQNPRERHRSSGSRGYFRLGEPSVRCASSPTRREARAGGSWDCGSFGGRLHLRDGGARHADALARGFRPGLAAAPDYWDFVVASTPALGPVGARSGAWPPSRGTFARRRSAGVERLECRELPGRHPRELIIGVPCGRRLTRPPPASRRLPSAAPEACVLGDRTLGMAVVAERFRTALGVMSSRPSARLVLGPRSSSFG